MKLNEIDNKIEKTISITAMITPEMEAIRQAFEPAFQIRFVGGVVRDLLLGQEPKDFDFATDATPDQMVEIGEANNFTMIPTGLQHGTMIFHLNGEDFEVTTLRIDTNQDGRHADTEWTTSWEEDSLRRDLTYNSLSMDFEGNIYDYHGGIADLETGKTKFVGDPNDRITEDYLRILRMFRFAGRYGHEITPKEKMAVSRNVKGLEGISGERIWAEMGKILSGNNTAMVLQDMKQTGVTNVIGLPVNDLTKIDMVKKATDNPVTIAMSLVNKPESLEHFIANWKWSNTEKKLAQFLMDNKFENFNIDQAKEMIVDGADPAHVIEMAHMRVNPQIAQEIKKWKVPVFPLQGRDLQEIMKPGPEMGKALNYAKALWKSGEFKPSKQELLKVLEPHLAERGLLLNK